MYKIAVLPGDGIGKEITAPAVEVLKAVAKKYGFEVETTEALIGGCAIDATGTPLPDETIGVCKSADAVILGAVGGPKWDGRSDGIRPEQGLLKIREVLGLFANLRPAIMYSALRQASPLKDEILGDGLDIMVVRELTGGIYFGERGREEKNGEQSAFDVERYSQSEVRRIAKVAFELARKRNGRVCSVDKANVLESSRLWRETVVKIAEDYKDIELLHMYVDNASMQLVRNPRQFDVIVTSNIFGDIISDEASQITGSIGMLPSASLREDSFGLYEPIHGSAPDIAGKNIANPLATILSVALMLRYTFGKAEAAQAIETAVNNVLESGARTADLVKTGEITVGTVEMGRMVLAEIEKI